MKMKHKIVFLGDSSVGKTSIANRMINGSFIKDSKPTVGTAFFSKQYKYDDLLYDFQIWDTAGEEKFRSMAPFYVQHASLAYIVFDISNRESFNHVGSWYQTSQSCGPIPVIIIGNKSDLDNRFSSPEELSDACSYYSNCVQYIETSALIGTGINEVFNEAVSSIISSKATPYITEDSIVSLSVIEETKTSCC